MGKLIEIQGDLLTHNAQYIAHQCNCISNRAKGLAEFLFKKYRYADEYSRRTTPTVPGTIQVFGDGITQRYIINMYAQYTPGKPRPNDDSTKRMRWFKDCMFKISQIPGITEVAFPCKIGSDRAGGNWVEYRASLEQFSREYPIDVYIIEKI